MEGRQLLAMVVDSFRSGSNADLVNTIKHLYDLYLTLEIVTAQVT